MTRPSRTALALALLGGLAACHTDPFSVKPEVRGVTIPEKPAPEVPADPAGDDDATAGPES